MLLVGEPAIFNELHEFQRQVWIGNYQFSLKTCIFGFNVVDSESHKLFSILFNDLSVHLVLIYLVNIFGQFSD
jgi:hypothetical protein